MLKIPKNQVSAVVLGTLQDGGLPHIACQCAHCVFARERPETPYYAACLALIDRRFEKDKVWMIDATPDIKHQLHLLKEVLGYHPHRPQRLQQPEGIFLTHAHMGHLGGLPQLGPEAMMVKNLKVYAAAGLIQLLQETHLWRPLIDNLDLLPLETNALLTLAPDLHILPLSVPHRDEWGVGTFAFQIQGPHHSLLYLPDIDQWEQWPEAETVLTSVDKALVDATFYNEDELKGRLPVAHPLVTHTLDLYGQFSEKLVFTHLNHTNPLLDKESKERQCVLDQGACIAETGKTFLL